MIRKLGRVGLLVALNGLLLVAFLELVGVIYFGMRDGRWYYAARHEIVAHRAAEMSTGASGADPGELKRKLSEGLSQIKYRLHPYYGFQYLPNTRVQLDIVAESDLAEAARKCKYRVNLLCKDGKAYFVTNNYGFDSVLDYPYRKQSDSEFVIGIFGSSVALSFVRATAPRFFEESLAQVPELRGKTITLLSFAQDSIKQPQQLEMLAYFLSIGQKFDLVVNIDGINEIEVPLHNYYAGVDYSMPIADSHIGVILGLFDTAVQEAGKKTVVAFYFWRDFREKILRSMARLPTAGPALLLDMAFRLVGRFEVHAQRAAIKPSSKPVLDRPFYLQPMTAGTTPEQAVEQGLEEWMQAELLTAAMLHRFGSRFLDVLQPSQYFSKKPFSDEEKRLLEEEGLYPRYLHAFYPRLVADGKALSAQGVNFASAVEIFDNVTETIYTDSCCHFNADGNALLGQFIAAQFPSAP